MIYIYNITLVIYLVSRCKKLWKVKLIVKVDVFAKCPESIPELPQKITEKDGAYL
jgi:hypothetical protein